MNQPTTTPFDAKEFRRALGTFPTGVAVITTLGQQGQPVGLTCNSFSSVSLEPPLVLWSLRKNSRSLADFQSAKRFAIHVLAQDQQAVSSLFASPSGNKFEGLVLDDAQLPRVKDCIAYFRCDTQQEVDAGDHVIFIGEVKAFEYREQEPLVFYRGAYKAVTATLREMYEKNVTDIGSLAEARSQIFELLVGLATQRATDEDIAQLERKLTEISAHADAGDMQQRAQASQDFFDVISDAAHNPVLSLLSQSLSMLMRQQLHASAAAMQWDGLHNPKLLPLREKIVQGIKERDEDVTRAHLKEYLGQSQLASWRI